jgi:transposase
VCSVVTSWPLVLAGGVITTVLRYAEQQVMRILSVSGDGGWQLTAMLALGYPLGHLGVAANRRPVHEVSSRNQWHQPLDDMHRRAGRRRLSCRCLLCEEPPQLRRVTIVCVSTSHDGRVGRPWEREEVPMPIVGGLDIHRKQLTFDYLDTVTGEVKRGQVAPADRAHLRAWLARFAGRQDVAFAVEGCTGWRYVAEELAAAGVAAHVGEPADTAAARGRKRHAKTDKTDSRHLRTLLAEGRLPGCWVPPAHILEYRALLETYHDLRTEHTAWVQRIHAVFFHQGAPALGEGALRTEQGLAGLRAAAAACLSPAGQVQVATALDMLAAVEARMDVVRKRLREAARQLTGAKVLAQRLYGVGPVTALALTCWLGRAGRFSSSRKAVRFTGLDVTVWSSDRKGPPGRLSRQGPPVLRWAVYEAGKAHARPSAPDHGYYAAVKDRTNGKRAALSEARKIVRQACHILAELGDDALTAA